MNNEKTAGGLKHIKSIFKRKKDRDGPSSSFQGYAGPAEPPQAPRQPENFPNNAPSIPMPQHQQPIRLNEDNAITAQRQESQQPNPEPEAQQARDVVTPSSLVTRPIPHDESPVSPAPPPPPPKDNVDLAAPPQPSAVAEDEDVRPTESTAEEVEREEEKPYEDVSKQEKEEAERDGVAEAASDDEDAAVEPGQTPKPKMSATSGPLEDIPAFVH